MSAHIENRLPQKKINSIMAHSAQPKNERKKNLTQIIDRLWIHVLKGERKRPNEFFDFYRADPASSSNNNNNRKNNWD